MAEAVQTGGVMQFRHEGETGKLDDERKQAIEQGYREAMERKKRERKQKILMWLIITAIVLALIIFALYLLTRN